MAAAQGATPVATAVATPSAAASVTVFKDLASTLQSMVTVGGVLAGAWWFYRRRQRFPAAAMSATVTSTTITDAKMLIDVDVVIENKGVMLLPVSLLRIRLAGLRPLSPAQTAVLNGTSGLVRFSRGIDPDKRFWTDIANHEDTYGLNTCEIEPLESEHFHYTFVADADVEVIRLSAFLRNDAKPDTEIGWRCVAIIDLRAAPADANNSAGAQHVVKGSGSAAGRDGQPIEARLQEVLRRGH